MLLFFHWDIDPVILNIGTFALRYYSLFFVLGLGSAYYLLQKRFVGKLVTKQQLDQLTLYIFLGTLIGARLGHCLFYEPNYFFAHPSEIFLPFHISDDGSIQFTGYQGLASHGGAVGILIGLFLYCKRHKESFLFVADKLALVIPLAGACIRIGIFFNSEIIGKPCRLPWAIVFARDDNLPRHPAQLYEAICYLVIFIFLWKKFGEDYPTRSSNGKVFGWFLLLTFLVRFFVDFVKAPQENFEKNMWLNMGQLLSLPFIGLSLVLIFKVKQAK